MDPLFRKPCLNTDGSTKHGWHSAASAKRALRKFQQSVGRHRADGQVLGKYRCPECGLYHIGHTWPGRPRK